jgi:hypothetical protein
MWEAQVIEIIKSIFRRDGKNNSDVSTKVTGKQANKTIKPDFSCLVHL